MTRLSQISELMRDRLTKVIGVRPVDWDLSDTWQIPEYSRFQTFHRSCFDSFASIAFFIPSQCVDSASLKELIQSRCWKLKSSHSLCFPFRDTSNLLE
jgi:hypothetical protein